MRGDKTLRTPEEGEDYVAMNVLPRRGAGDGGGEMSKPADQTRLHTTTAKKTKTDRHSIMCGREREREGEDCTSWTQKPTGERATQ